MPQSEVIVTTLNLCEKYLIKFYQHGNKTALDVKEKNSEEIKKRVFFKFIIDAYEVLLHIYPMLQGKKDLQKIASGLFYMMPDLDIFNIVHHDEDNKVWDVWNQGILSQISNHRVPVVKALLSCNRGTLNLQQKTLLLQACLMKYSDVVLDNNPCLDIVIQYLKPTDPAVQHLVKEYVVKNDEHKVAKLLRSIGIFCSFPGWEETVQKSKLPDSLKKEFVNAEEKRKSYRDLVSIAATCKPIRSIALAATPKNYGSIISFNDYGQLAFFTLFHDIQNTCPEVVDQYQATVKASTI